MIEITKLRERGVELSPPASDIEIEKLRFFCDPSVFDYLYQYIYRLFDGFRDGDFDEASFLRIWPIDRIVTSQKRGNICQFMDFSLDSETYALMNGCGSIIYRSEPMVATDIKVDNLITDIVHGRFDFGLGL